MGKKQHQFFHEGKHRKTFSKRYKPVFTASMIEAEGKRLSVKEKFNVEWALFKLDLKKSNVALWDYLKDRRAVAAFQVTDFYDEGYHELQIDNGASVRVPSKLYHLFLGETKETAANFKKRNY